ncbi:SPOR domain-containing protein [Carboxylicivirga linearis]|uniref:SPOR domain-containing protein n=1 Tax=Carboxylicivirga linearis TaxID=1628157 RepID=A0ABS5JZH6_9BACT|nr:SPOR domain-containing protein [Carboxylicivirga linearis]MBS2100305.1 SPOR domain-containing protein [Carboxylicivirga linearis]
MKHFLIIIITCIGFGFSTKAQNLTEEVQTIKEGQGVVTIHQDQGIDFLMETMVKENERKGGVDGYQIQLFSGSGPQGKRNAMDVKTKVLEEFPDAKITTTYNPPFWRVRVGSYRNKHEALPLLKDLKEFFPNCYVVKGMVRMEEL